MTPTFHLVIRTSTLDRSHELLTINLQFASLRADVTATSPQNMNLHHRPLLLQSFSRLDLQYSGKVFEQNKQWVLGVMHQISNMK